MHITLYIKCPACLSDNIKKNGFKSYGKQNYKCKDCKPQFIGDHALTYQGCHSQKDSKIRHLMGRGSGIKDIACVEKIIKVNMTVLNSMSFRHLSGQTHIFRNSI